MFETEDYLDCFPVLFYFSRFFPSVFGLLFLLVSLLLYVFVVIVAVVLCACFKNLRSSEV